MYSILFENNVTIIHLAKELTMKKYFKFVSSILTATISPTNWKAVSTSAGIVGATQIVTLRGRNSKWSVTLTNNIIDSMP